MQVVSFAILVIFRVLFIKVESANVMCDKIQTFFWHLKKYNFQILLLSWNILVIDVMWLICIIPVYMYKEILELECVLM